MRHVKFLCSWALLVVACGDVSSSGDEAGGGAGDGQGGSESNAGAGGGTSTGSGGQGQGGDAAGGGAGMSAGGGGGSGSAGGLATGGMLGTGGGTGGLSGTGGSPGTGGNAPTGMGGSGGGGNMTAGGSGPVLPPGDGLTAAAQAAIVKQWQAKAVVGGARDGQGNYTAINIWNDLNAPKARIDDGDLQKILGFNQLLDLQIHNQKVTASGVKVIERLPSLEALRFQYMNKAVGIDTDFMLVANAHAARLETLVIKHMFGLSGTSVDRLGAFPKLKYVVLDQDSSGPKAVTFLKKVPSVEGLELHRTKMTDGDIAQVAQALPNLKCLHIKVDGPMTGQGIANAFKNHPSLQVIWPHSISVPPINGVASVGSGTDAKWVCRDYRMADGMPSSVSTN